MLMDHSLGRPLEKEVRLHLARCKRCQSRLHQLEEQLLHEAIEFKGQASYPFQTTALQSQR